MITVRHGVFETNSSSCHVMTVMSDELLEELKKDYKDRIRKMVPIKTIRRGDEECGEVGVIEIIEDDAYAEEAFKNFGEKAKTITLELAKAIVKMTMEGKACKDIVTELPSVDEVELDSFVYAYVLDGYNSARVQDLSEAWYDQSIPVGNGKNAVLMSVAC